MASLRAECLEMVPSVGESFEVIMLRRVDFPVLMFERHEQRNQLRLRGKGRKGKADEPVVSDDGDTRVHVDTEVEVLVEVVLLLTRVRERDVREGNDGRGKLGDVLESEVESLASLDGLDETGGLHLIDDLYMAVKRWTVSEREEKYGRRKRP
jgi:hypothetical protein